MLVQERKVQSRKESDTRGIFHYTRPIGQRTEELDMHGPVLLNRSRRSIFISTAILTFLFTFPQKFELLLNEKGLEMIRSKRITSARISICFERSTVGDKLLIKFGADCVLIYNFRSDITKLATFAKV